MCMSRYDKVPSDFTKMNDGDASSASAAGSLLSMSATVSRLFHHRRWIWSMQCFAGNPVSVNSVGRILSHLAK